MPTLVTKEMAMALRDAGYPQDLDVGDWGYHPMATTPDGLVKCVLKRKRSVIADAIEIPVIKAPTKDEARAWIHENKFVTISV